MRLAHIRFDRCPITFDGDAKGGPDQADEDQSPQNDDYRFHDRKFWHAMTPGKALFSAPMQHARSVICSRLLHEARACPSMRDIADELHLDPRTLRLQADDERRRSGRFRPV